MATVQASIDQFRNLEKALPGVNKQLGLLISRMNGTVKAIGAVSRAAEAVSRSSRKAAQGMEKAATMQKSLSKSAKSIGQFVQQLDKLAALSKTSQSAASSAAPAQPAAQGVAATSGGAAKGGGLAQSMTKGIGAMNKALQTSQKLWGQLTKVTAYSDRIQSINLQLALANDGLRTQADLHRQVMDASNATNASYETTAAMVGKLSQSPDGTFRNNDDAMAFTGRFNKVLAASGVQSEGRAAVSADMTKSMAGGKLDGGALKSLSQQASLLPVILAEGLGVAQSELMRMAEAGELTSAVIASAFDNQSQRIDEMFANTPATFGEAMTLMKNQAAGWMSGLQGAEGPMQRITQLIMSLAAWLASDAGQQFFHGLAVGATLFVDVMGSAVQLLIDNMAIVQYVLLAVGVVLAALAVQWLFTWLAAIWPILLVIGIITGIMYVLDKLGVSAGEVVGFIAGLFGFLFATLVNTAAVIYNPIIMLIEFLFNLGTSSVQFFYELAGSVVGFFQRAINDVIDGLNWIVEKLNAVPGIEIPVITSLDETLLKGLEPPTKKPLDLSKYKLKNMDPVETFGAWSDKGVKMFDKASSSLSGFSMDKIVGIGSGLPAEKPGKPGMLPDIDKVNQVGSINDSVDISSEDLKIMRDLAELDAIQNFVTLTPTVQVTTGPIMQEVDVDDVIQRITSTVEREIESSAQGVYSL